MQQRQPRGVIPRGDRRPLYVQVHTDPPLTACWSVNISPTGNGLVATVRTTQQGPREGDAIDLEFPLPGARSRLRLRGDVRWRHDSPEVTGGPNVALGVSFRQF